MPRGKEIKRGTTSKASQFIDRDRALFKLQLTLRDFRKLCILKGIYPRVPPNDVKKRNKVHYLIKDIMFLMHDPIISQIRKYKTYRRKLRKFHVRHEKARANSLKKTRPDFSFDHMVKERYPTFVEALRDLDDALCMVFLFATLPVNRWLKDFMVERCSRLTSEWMSFVIKSRSLRRVFCSIKGVYFQSSVMGETVSWLVPYPYTPNVPENVDFKVMMTFLEFHTKHLEFVLFRLYAQMGLSYPPVFDQSLAGNGATILAYQFKPVGDMAIEDKKKDNDEDDEEKDEDDEEEEVQDEEQARAIEAEVEKIQSSLRAMGMDAEAFDEPEDAVAAENEMLDKAGDEFRQLGGGVEGGAELDPLPTLFRGLVFFVGRENLRDVLYLSLAACGATAVGWEGPDSPFDASHASITHIICDRPTVTEPRLDVEYVQPQWVFDSINFSFLLPAAEYAPGKALPPHLSPFVNDEAEGYVPERKQQILRYIEQTKSGKIPSTMASVGGAADDEERELDEDQMDHRDAEDFYQEDLARETGREAQGDAVKRAKARRRQRQEEGEAQKEEEKNLAAGTLPRKKKRLFDRIQYSKKAKSARADMLKQKAREAAKASKK